MWEELFRKGVESGCIAGDMAAPTRVLDEGVATSRDPEYWFDDGNIILVSQGVAFRVYKGLLAEHSMIFRSMFHVAQRVPPSEDLVEGCPVVPLDDSPNDLRQLFRLIFPLSGNLKFHGPKVDIAFISSVTRLDHKYELQGLYGEAMRYLTSYYTTSFDAWADGGHAVLWQPDPIHAIRAIGLARLAGTPSILPTAFYICATLGPDIVHGCPTNDNGGDGCVERLTPDDLRTVLELKARLATENARTAFLLFRGPVLPPCQRIPFTKARCCELWRPLLEHAGVSEPEVPLPHPVASVCALDSWVANIRYLPLCFPTPSPVNPEVYVPGKGWFRMPKLCAPCRSHLETRDRQLRREVWRKLPGFLGINIEGWDA